MPETDMTAEPSRGQPVRAWSSTSAVDGRMSTAEPSRGQPVRAWSSTSAVDGRMSTAELSALDRALPRTPWPARIKTAELLTRGAHDYPHSQKPPRQLLPPRWLAGAKETRRRPQSTRVLRRSAPVPLLPALRLFSAEPALKIGRRGRFAPWALKPDGVPSDSLGWETEEEEGVSPTHPLARRVVQLLPVAPAVPVRVHLAQSGRPLIARGLEVVAKGDEGAQLSRAGTALYHNSRVRTTSPMRAAQGGPVDRLANGKLCPGSLSQVRALSFLAPLCAF
ncbi:hypothetical protein T492DRAFT_1149871 [Pavlovales sp. CCMP2436]|nr:hypothetical protein T492DRAFT_1149871 [Pavlovales sp. CCMP2436]